MLTDIVNLSCYYSKQSLRFLCYVVSCCVVLCCVVLCRVIEAASLSTLSLLFFQLRDNYCQTLETCTVAFCLPKKWTGSDANVKPRHNFFRLNTILFLCSILTFLPFFWFEKKHYQCLIVRIPELIITVNCLLNFCLILTINNEIFSNLVLFLLTRLFLK